MADQHNIEITNVVLTFPETDLDNKCVPAPPTNWELELRKFQLTV